MNKTLAGKAALITGGARGIGRATALKLASHGCNVVVNYYNSSDLAESLCDEIKSMGVEAFAVQGNVADPDSVKEIMEAFRSHFDHLDILISNAASGVLKHIKDMKLKHFRWCMETNAYSLCALATVATPIMPQGSSIIALSSLGAERAIPNYGFIGASKAALESLVRSLALELAQNKIRVNAVSAGVVDTDALSHFPNREQLLTEYGQRALSGRGLLPSDVADSIYLLCLPEAAMINGHTLLVDSGYSILG